MKEKLHVPCCSFCSTDCDGFEMTAVVRSLSALVTSRYHAAVLSMEKSIPIVSISMDERLDELMQDIGMDQDVILRTDDPELGIDLYDAMKCSGKQKDQIRSRIREKVTEYKEIMMEMGVFLEGYIKREWDRK